MLHEFAGEWWFVMVQMPDGEVFVYDGLGARDIMLDDHGVYIRTTFNNGEPRSVFHPWARVVSIETHHKEYRKGKES